MRMTSKIITDDSLEIIGTLLMSFSGEWYVKTAENNINIGQKIQTCQSFHFTHFQWESHK